MDRETEEEDFASHPLLVPTKKLYFQDKGSILKASRHTRKMDSTESQSYFKPRSNIKPKNKRGIFRKMAFKIYLQLSLPIAIQQVTENEAIKKKHWRHLQKSGRYLCQLIDTILYCPDT